MVKVKKGEEALAVAEKAVELALTHTDKDAWVIKQSAYEALGTAYHAVGDRPREIDAFCKMCENRNPHFGCKFRRLGFDAIAAVMRDGKTDEALEYLERVRALDNLDIHDFGAIIDLEGRCCKVGKNWECLLDVYARAWADTNLCAQIGPISLIDKCVGTYKDSSGGYRAV